MMNSAKHLSSNNYYVIVVFAFALAQVGCSKEEKPAKYIAKVNKSVLTEDDVKLALSEERNKGIYREEYINNWIKTEILFEEAVDNEILDDKEFKSLLERNKKELAAALFMKKIINESKIEPADDEIKKYFDDNKDDFKLADEAYKINEVQFNDYNKAINNMNDKDYSEELIKQIYVSSRIATKKHEHFRDSLIISILGIIIFIVPIISLLFYGK